MFTASKSAYLYWLVDWILVAYQKASTRSSHTLGSRKANFPSVTFINLTIPSTVDITARLDRNYNSPVATCMCCNVI